MLSELGNQIMLSNLVNIAIFLFEKLKLILLSAISESVCLLLTSVCFSHEVFKI